MSNTIALEITFEVFADLSTLLLEYGYSIDTAHRIIGLAMEDNTGAISTIERAIQVVAA